MAMRSSIAQHPKRSEIEAAIIQGLSDRRIAKQYGISDSAVLRYRKSVLPAVIEQAEAARVRKGVVPVLDRLEKLYQRSEKFLDVARDAKVRGLKPAAGLVGAQLRVVERIGKLTGEIRDEPREQASTGPQLVINLVVAGLEQAGPLVPRLARASDEQSEDDDPQVIDTTAETDAE